MNIVKRELRANLKSQLIWMFALAFLVAVWMIEYDSFASNPAINEFMAALPQGLLSALGMGEMSLTSLNGFVGSISLYLYLLLGIQAVLLGSSIIFKEERDKTGEYLFSMPITRVKIVANKMISAIINILIINATTLGAMFLSTSNYQKEEDFYQFILLTFIAIFIVQMIFLSVGMLVSAISKNHKKSANISVSILMGAFVISSLIDILDSLSFLTILTPFKYFQFAYIQNEMILNPLYLLVSIIVIVLGFILTLIIYPKRDLYI